MGANEGSDSEPAGAGEAAAAGPLPPNLAEMRRRAEADASAAVLKRLGPAGVDPERLVHELGVHQVELQMQNEELMRA